jgi:hypothetical protein
MFDSTSEAAVPSCTAVSMQRQSVILPCRICATELNTTTECKHETIAERALVGTWVTDKLRLAVRKGYHVIEVYEVYEYDVTQYDPTAGERGLFVQYINTFLKLKAKASEYPNWVLCPEDCNPTLRILG